MFNIPTKIILVLAIIIISIWVFAALVLMGLPHIASGVAAFDELADSEYSYSPWTFVVSVGLISFGPALQWATFSTVFLYTVIALGIFTLGRIVIRLINSGSV